LDRNSHIIRCPDYNQDDIVKNWGYPAEIRIHEHTVKMGDNVTTWIYYAQYHDGSVSPVVFNLRKSASRSTNAFGLENRGYKLLNPGNVEDVKVMLSNRRRFEDNLSNP
jgi:hypothetical protein